MSANPATSTVSKGSPGLCRPRGALLAPGAPGARRRAAASVNLDQWATVDDAWQNGNLNGNNTRYPEGGIVPFRVAVEGLKAGAHSIRIQYDFTAGRPQGVRLPRDLQRLGEATDVRCGGGGDLVDVPVGCRRRARRRSRPIRSRRTA